MALVSGNLTLDQLNANQVTKCYELEAQKKVAFQVFVPQNRGEAVQNHLTFAWATAEGFDLLHAAVKEILAVE